MEHGKVITEGTVENVLSKPELLRSHSLRLPRIAYLMEILNKEGKLEIDTTAATISAARMAIKKIIADNPKKGRAY